MMLASSGSRFMCRSLNINEDLGQMRYVSSDKMGTGTLTENKMEFKRASVHGKNYESSLLKADNNTGAANSGKQRWRLKSEIAVDSKLMALLQKDSNRDERVSAHEFFLTLSACNTVIPNMLGVDYQGESPDEQTLVSAASAYRYTLFERTSGTLLMMSTVRNLGK